MLNFREAQIKEKEMLFVDMPAQNRSETLIARNLEENFIFITNSYIL